MYIPAFFAETDVKALLAFMREFNFATLVSAEKDYPTATHLPFIIEEHEDKLVLAAHMAKANPQWQELGDKDALVIFHEPHAYVSPLLYTDKLNVPTWNYVAVHAYGKVKILETVEENIALLEKLMAIFDPQYFATNWQEIPYDYKVSRSRAIVAFEIEVTDLQGKKKLNQNKPGADAQNVIAAFEKSESKNEQRIARFMKEVHDAEK
jgi:transcriptional regulator